MKEKSLLGIVIIGRNEGERLRKCLESCIEQSSDIIYVDSGSTDSSVELAKALGVDVVNLDVSLPFTAARARNSGVKRLQEINSKLKYVQFVDGDCEIFSDWLPVAVSQLETNADYTIVCGRLRERYPDASVYNRICDMEWNELPGEVTGCGGIFMVRLSEFNALEGFNSDIIAGEEPELCLRIRREGGKVFRLTENMAWHDANMMHFGQWWKREIRNGHAYAEGMAMYLGSPERYRIRESATIWFWAAVLPVILFLLSNFINSGFFLLILVYPYKIWRISQWASHQTNQIGDNWLYALTCIGAKWPKLIGQLIFIGNRLKGKKTRLIEHK